jgi:hypothetical protein
VWPWQEAAAARVSAQRSADLLRAASRGSGSSPLAVVAKGLGLAEGGLLRVLHLVSDHLQSSLIAAVLGFKARATLASVYAHRRARHRAHIFRGVV